MLAFAGDGTCRWRIAPSPAPAGFDASWTAIALRADGALIARCADGRDFVVDPASGAIAADPASR